MLRGDSTMYGSHPGEYNGNVPDQTPTNPAALMQADFDALFPGRVTVINRAEPGSWLSNDINGTGPYTAGTLAQELAANPSVDIVVTNSEVVDRTFGSASDYRNNLATWIATVRAAHMIPWIEEPNPVCRTWLLKPWWNAPPLRDDREFLSIQRSVVHAQNVASIPLYDAFLAQPDWTLLLQIDCTHPADAGYRFKEARAFKYLEPLVAQMLAK
jgi:hypothetical protein